MSTPPPGPQPDRAAALLVAAERPGADTLPRSRLFDDGTRLAAADLHNHTLLSDGAGEPEDAFASLRGAGLQVAALTDHASLGWGALSRAVPLRPFARHGGYRAVIGLDEDGWERTGAIADAADQPGAFTALRGFEWSHPLLGHVNVWFTRTWTDALSTTGVGWDGIGDEARRIPGLGPALDRVLSAIPGDPGMDPFYDWLSRAPGEDRDGGGLEGLAGFNHPGREPGWFDAFRHDARVAERIVSVEAFNKTDDYLFDDPTSSPLVACLNAGWRVGLSGVSDEHGTDWGRPLGKGRTGLWLRELSREGVREALTARRFFATRERGLRLDASIGGARMGTALAHRRGPVEVVVDLGHAEWAGREVQVQVLRPGELIPQVAHVETVTLAGDDAPPVRFTVDLDVADGPWVVLRVADPAAANRSPGPGGHPGNLRGLAYASPVWLEPVTSPG